MELDFCLTKPLRTEKYRGFFFVKLALKILLNSELVHVKKN
jgi:hypothetical protein